VKFVNNYNPNIEYGLNGKNQIILVNTNCSLDEQLTKIELRYNKKYNKIPHFTISKQGFVYKHLNPESITGFFDELERNEVSITVALENVGWLEYDNSTEKYFDWRNIEYSGEVIKKTWRGKENWSTYSFEQTQALIELIDYLCLEYYINNNFIGHNVFTNTPTNFSGVLNRSNINKNYYDLTPAFDFNKLSKYI